MEDGGPDSRPSHDLWVHGHIIMRDDIVDGVVEEADQAGHSNNCQRLSGEEAKNHCCKSRREQRFVDAEELPRSAVHVQCERDSWKEAEVVSFLSKWPKLSYKLLVCKVYPEES
jgi:hypothetical protein